MRLFSMLVLLIISLSFAASAFADRDPKKDAIKARQGEMQLRSFNAGPLFAMAKGDMPYDAEMASMLANNLKVMLNLNNGRAWMPGTSVDDYPDDTKALPDIWESDSEIRDRGKDYGKAVNELAAAAGNGRDALTDKVKQLGKACKGCHDDYQEDDE